MTTDQLLTDHHDEARMRAVVALPVSTWRDVAAAVRYCADGVAAEHRPGVGNLVNALDAIREAIAARIPDTSGQGDFAAEIMNTPDMTDAQRIHWLYACYSAAIKEAAAARAGSRP